MGETLFGDDAPPKRTRKTKAETDGVVGRLLDLFKAEHEARTGVRYLVKHGKDQKLLRQLATASSEEETAAAIRLMFGEAYTDAPILRSNLDVGALSLHIQHLRLRGQRPTDLRTISNLDAASRATRRR